MPSVPKRASARTTASAKLMPFSGSATSKTRPSAKPTRSGGISSFFAAVATSISFARSAAWIAALPVMNVTREE